MRLWWSVPHLCAACGPNQHSSYHHRSHPHEDLIKMQPSQELEMLKNGGH